MSCKKRTGVDYYRWEKRTKDKDEPYQKLETKSKPQKLVRLWCGKDTAGGKDTKKKYGVTIL